MTAVVFGIGDRTEGHLKTDNFSGSIGKQNRYGARTRVQIQNNFRAAQFSILFNRIIQFSRARRIGLKKRIGRYFKLKAANFINKGWITGQGNLGFAGGNTRFAGGNIIHNRNNRRVRFD